MREDLLEEYLQRYGWKWFVSYKDDTKVWCTGWKSQIKSFPLNISFTDTWILFEVDPFISLDPSSNTELIFKSLLELNQDIHMVKIGLTENNDLTLKLQLLASNMSYKDFSNSLGILAYYCDLLYASIVEANQQDSLKLDTYSMIL